MNLKRKKNKIVSTGPKIRSKKNIVDKASTNQNNRKMRRNK